jgi:DnaJ-like protein
LSSDLSKAYELLGVKPGVSSRELKAAHRDLAKVWHPDRFLHDPRLQAKAQEKLKEINEAYELLSSPSTPRACAASGYTPVVKRQRRTGRGMPAAVAMFVFIAVFAITIRVLLQHRTQPPATEVDAYVDQQASTRSEAPARSDAPRKPGHDDTAAPEINSTPAAALPSEPTPALATVTVSIDPKSGLLARPDCPVRSRMTYPRGNEPSGYCNLVHATPPKESRIKSIAEKILPPRRKGAKEESDAKN